jgi:hypothetical protein
MSKAGHGKARARKYMGSGDRNGAFIRGRRREDVAVGLDGSLLNRPTRVGKMVKAVGQIHDANSKSHIPNVPTKLSAKSAEKITDHKIF